MKREEYIIFVEQEHIGLLADELNEFATLESKMGFMFDYVGVLYENIGLKFKEIDRIDYYSADCCFVVFSINSSENFINATLDYCEGYNIYGLDELPSQFVAKICQETPDDKGDAAYSIKIKGRKLHDYYLDSLRVKGETVLGSTEAEGLFKSRFNMNMYFHDENVIIMEDPLSLIDFRDGNLFYSNNYDRIHNRVFPDMMISVNHMPIVLRIAGEVKKNKRDTIDAYIERNIDDWVQYVKKLNGIGDEGNQT